MDTKFLNTRKREVLDQQEAMLKSAVESKRDLTDVEKTQFDNFTAELDSINANIARSAAVAKGKIEVATPREAAVITDSAKAKKFFAVGGYRTPTVLSNIDDEYVSKFYKSLKSSAAFQNWTIQNAALGEGGTTADGSALVPIETDPTIPNLAMVECSARSLSKVITTDMNINIPYQSARSVAAIKAESNNGGTNAFGTSVPQFDTTLLSAYVVGNSVYASWELLEDAKAANQFIPTELQRAIRVEEEYYFVNGTGSSQPQGYLGNGTAATGDDAGSGTASLSTDAILDTVSSLNRAYYPNASWLVNRQEFNRLLKKQLAASQYQTFVTWDANGNARLLGYPVSFSTEMPVYVASPATTGAWMFGDFNAFAVIGNRGDSNIRVKLLDQVAALNGQTVILGYRRTDQRIVLSEAVVQLTTNG
jgi:HK97 family phage major capsid protein